METRRETAISTTAVNVSGGRGPTVIVMSLDQEKEFVGKVGQPRPT